MKNWTRREKTNDDLLAQLLENRGLTSPEARDIFLNPKYDRDLHDPFLMKGMDRAVSRIIDAIERGEKVVIFGDYDADGVPGSAVLFLFFKTLGHPVDVYIPDRHNEAYGLNTTAIEKLAATGMKLLITVDCGITNVEEVKRANELGINVIITDHHLAPATLPEAVAILDSKQPDDNYPYQMLCGAGVAFKLVQALVKASASGRFSQVLGKNPQTVPKSSAGPSEGSTALSVGWEKWLLDLVAIATISDMVPLDGENRALAYFGLKVLRQTRRPGLLTLYNKLGISASQLTEDDVSFSIGPRLNTASRMSHASQAFHLLTTDDPRRAETIARHLEEKNTERRNSVDVILEAIEARFDVLEPQPILVAGDPTWSLGVLGLTAARVVEKYNCPVFLWGKNGAGEIKGSCRSDGSVNVVELMSGAGGSDYFSNFGGHVMAGGFSVGPERGEELEERLRRALEEMARAEVANDLLIDAELKLEDVTEQTWQVVEQLAPFGVGNSKPTFLFEWVVPSTVRTFGSNNNHLEIVFETKSGKVKAICFFAGRQSFPGLSLTAGEPFDMVATIEKSYFRNRPELRLRIVDIKKPV